MEQRAAVQNWRRLCTHQEQQQEQSHEQSMEQDMEKVERIIERFMWGFENLMIKIICPAFVVFMVYQLAKAGWI